MRASKRHAVSVEPEHDNGQDKKKRKLSPQFWDNLSTVPLTHNALREFDRRTPSIPSDAAPRITETAENILSSLPPVSLQKIKHSSRHGGTDLQHLRGMKTATTSTRSTGPYDSAFQQHLTDHNIFPDEYEYPDGTKPPAPENMEKILESLSRRRLSLSPSQVSKDEFLRFKKANAHAHKEGDVTSAALPIIEGDVGDLKCASGEVPFTNLDDLTDGTLVPGNPDRYYGARPEQLERKVRTDLNGQVVPSTQHDLLVAPNFFLHVKGPDGTQAVALRQACYDGALGARGIQSLLTYGKTEAIYDNTSYTLTSVYHGGTLQIYASQPIAPKAAGDSCGYSMTLIKGFFMAGDLETFRAGVAAYRNGRDWAKEHRDRAINQANALAGRGTKLTEGAPTLTSSASLTETASEELTSAMPSACSKDSESSEETFRKGRRSKRRSPEKRNEAGC